MRGERLYGLTIKCTHADAHRRILVIARHTKSPTRKGETPRPARARGARQAAVARSDRRAAGTIGTYRASAAVRLAVAARTEHGVPQWRRLDKIVSSFLSHRVGSAHLRSIHRARLAPHLRTNLFES